MASTRSDESKPRHGDTSHYDTDTLFLFENRWQEEWLYCVALLAGFEVCSSYKINDGVSEVYRNIVAPDKVSSVVVYAGGGTVVSAATLSRFIPNADKHTAFLKGNEREFFADSPT